MFYHVLTQSGSVLLFAHQMIVWMWHCKSWHWNVRSVNRAYQDPEKGEKWLLTWYFADNKISKIPWHALAGLPNLEWLDLSKNKLDDFSLGPDVFRVRWSQRNLNILANILTHNTYCLFSHNNLCDISLDSKNDQIKIDLQK